MISINILFPSEKKRIKSKISKEIKKKYNKGVKRFKWHHIGDQMVYLYVYLDDETLLYITAEINRIVETMTISDDFSL